MKCPRCQVDLNNEVIRDLKVAFKADHCSSCGGIWFDNGELEAIDKVIEPTFWEIRNIPSKNEQYQKLICPSCDENSVLIKRSHARDKNVIIDQCDQCKGIWLDKGELEAIQKENWLITLGKVTRWLFGAD